MVVIAIISLLVSMLLPSLQKAKELAHEVVCMSNLRNIFFAWRLYVDENDGQSMKPWGYLPGEGVAKGNWFAALLGSDGTANNGVFVFDKEPNYLEAKDVLICPSGHFPAHMLGGPASYGMTRLDVWGHPDSPIKTDLISRFFTQHLNEPDVWPLFLDAKEATIGKLLSLEAAELQTFPGRSCLEPRHSEQELGNVCFVDGHLESVLPGDPKYTPTFLNQGNIHDWR